MKRVSYILLFIAVIFIAAVSCKKEQEDPTVAVTGVVISPESLGMEVGDQQVLTATVSPNNATNKNITFTSSKKSVATVSADGIVEAIAPGKAIITVTTEDGNFKAHCSIEVTDKIMHVTGIALNKTTLTLAEGDNFTLVPTITPENADDKSVSWKSNNEAIAIVSTDGVVTALAAGKATITATSVDQGKTASCTIEVSEAMNIVTGDVTHISCRNAVISGKIVFPKVSYSDQVYGVVFSTSSDVQKGGSLIKPKDNQTGSEYIFSVTTPTLEPETTYYYCSYFSQAGEIIYGETKSFKTLPVSSMIQTLDVTDINSGNAKLNAKVNLTDCIYTTSEYGFKIVGGGEVKGSHIVWDGNFNIYSGTPDWLSSETEYSYYAYVKLADSSRQSVTYNGETKSFRTTSLRLNSNLEASNISYHTATISGLHDIESGTTHVSTCLYYSSTENTVDALKSSGSKAWMSRIDDGICSVDLSSLASDTQYYYVAVSTFQYDSHELVSDVRSFRTEQIKADVIAGPSNLKSKGATISGKIAVESVGTFTKSAEFYYSLTANTLEALKSSGTKSTVSLSEDGEYAVTLDGLEINHKYYYCVIGTVDDVVFNTVSSFNTLDYQEPEVVDLGLSVMWASFNLGATSPDEYGGFYQWAGLEDVYDTSICLDISNCPYHTGSEYLSGWTKYVLYPYYGDIVDGKTVLDPEDDLAHVKLGGKWRIPTEAEWAELIDNCTSTWTYNYKVGLYGRIFTSNKAGYTDRSISLPAAGVRWNNSLVFDLYSGYYWSSTTMSLGEMSRYMTFNSSNVQCGPTGRYGGLSIRPVCDK